MFYYNDKNELMEEDELQDVMKRGYCCIREKPLCNMKKCPIDNFDDDGIVCVPHLCDEFVKMY